MMLYNLVLRDDIALNYTCKFIIFKNESARSTVKCFGVVRAVIYYYDPFPMDVT